MKFHGRRTGCTVRCEVYRGVIYEKTGCIDDCTGAAAFGMIVQGSFPDAAALICILFSDSSSFSCSGIAGLPCFTLEIYDITTISRVFAFNSHVTGRA